MMPPNMFAFLAFGAFLATRWMMWRRLVVHIFVLFESIFGLRPIFDFIFAL